MDQAKLPLFVHALQSADAFTLAQKVWQNNSRSLMVDASNHKEFLRFVFSKPDCTVWLQRDQGRSDSYEVILVWGGGKDALTEVYVISTLAGIHIGDDSRIKSLLSSILASPAIVPVTK